MRSEEDIRQYIAYLVEGGWEREWIGIDELSITEVVRGFILNLQWVVGDAEAPHYCKIHGRGYDAAKTDYQGCEVCLEEYLHRE